ncbi:SpaA isopeptide-forming pilin-related protein [Enterococcus sp. 5H]|uniref:SpaA isopeptide-forming pilin-related protein n=1 Tax=Enterococcus sp. 5H TaxID=1229490 RepID=UPI00230409DD|nr:SpaA isopeptide-forming pilin-related protein [Enterococcus sp. 5H]MDA9471007.1 hypothetical protein [Enterococcus sp. 5H]
MEKNYGKKIIYGIMTLLIFIQYFIPIISIAETFNKKEAESLQLNNVEVKNLDSEEATIEIKGQVVNNGTQMIEKELSFSNAISLADQSELKADGSADINYLINENKIYLKITAGSTGDFLIKVPIDQKQLRSLQNISVLNGNQTVTTEITTKTNTSSNPEQEQAASSSTTESSKTADNNTVIPKADTPSDIRTYFPNNTGTIIDNASVVYKDKAGNILTAPIPADADVTVHYDWSIPEEIRSQIKAGDYFTFNLPNEVKINGPQSGSLKGPDGEVYATYTLDENGKVTITFNENVTTEIDIKGDFNFNTVFDTEHIDGPGDHQITFPTEDNVPPIDVVVKPSTSTSIAKDGHFDRTPNPTSVEWTVDFNQGMNELSNPEITEHWPAGIDYKSVKVYKLVMNLDGTIKEVAEELDPSQYTVDANGNVKILGDTSDAYRIVYQTDINESVIPDDGGNISFTNRATLSDDNDVDGIDAKDTVTSEYGKMVEKNRSNYDPNAQEFSWEIKYNYGEKTIEQDQAVITDTLSSNMDLVADSVHIYNVTFGPNGEEIKGAELSTPGDYTLEPNPNGSGFVVKFTHDIDSAYKIEYKSKVNTIITDPTAVNNSVDVGTGEHGEGSGNANQQNVIKNLTTVDYENNSVNWKVQVNNNHYYMKDLEIEDTFQPVPGLTLAKNPDGNSLLTIKSSNGTTLVYGQDYTIEEHFDAASQETGFTIKFLAPTYNPTTDSFVIEYTTNFDSELIDPRDPDLDHFTNDVFAQWKDQNGDDHHSDDGDNFTPDPDYSLNAKKGGLYNAQTKLITWTSTVNLSGHLLTDAYFKDTIKDNQKYVSDSLKIYEGRTQPDGTVQKIDDVPDNDRMISVQEPSVENGQLMDIRFPNESQYTYVIEFQTSLVGEVIDDSQSYENVAEYSNNGLERDVIGEVTVKNGGSHLQKNGKLDPNDPSYVIWNLTINPAQSTLSNVVVHDYPSDNQIADKESIKLYETTVNELGDVTPDKTRPFIEGTDYSVEMTTDNVTGDQVITVTFLHEISKAYYMEYRSLVNSSAAGSTDTVSNKADITGDGTKTITDDSGHDITVPVDHTGGNASGKKGSITFQKTKEDQSTFLTGAHFQLWNTTMTQVLREGDVDASGKIQFGNLQLGEYLLFETSAPNGYTIPDNLIYGLRIKITAETSDVNAAPMKIVNTPNKVILTKTGESGEKLAGAEFKLERQDASLWLPISVGNLVTDSQGKLTIDSLLPGHYRINETKAPTGYLLNTTPIEFDVLKNANNQIPTVNLAMVDYQGSAELQKNDEEGNSLIGAVFKVVDQNGNIVQDNLTSDLSGKVNVTGLAPGNYKFVETKAPNGYILNTEEYSFSIINSDTGKPETIEVGTAINYQGIAQLVKTDKSGTVLAGAEFKVVDSNNNTIKDQLVSDGSGVVSIEGLAPGNYKFIETKAPDGYLLNTQPVSFTISASANGKPTVIQAGSLKNFKGSFEIKKVDTTVKPLAGAVFSLFDENHQPLNQSVTTDKNGLALFENLSPGTYYVEETKAPELPDGSDYVINQYQIKVVIPESAQEEPQVINLGDFQNFKGKAVITKEGNGREIAGAVFDLFLFDKVTGTERKIAEVTSANDGNIPIDNLGAGSYKLVETKPAPGFIINTQPIYFVVDPNLIDQPEDELKFENYQVSVQAKKIDGDGLGNNLESNDQQALAGSEFQIFKQNEDGSRGEKATFYDKDGNQTDTLISDKDGGVLATGLESGSYLLVETKANSGYVLNKREIPFEVTPELGEPQPINLETFSNYRGKMDITKTSETDQKLTGGTFILTKNKDTKVPVTVLDKNGEETEELHADGGHITAQGIEPGVYYLIETAAPSGYILNTNPIEVTITAESTEKAGLTVNGNLINYQGSAVLTKVGESDDPLAGAEFKVVDKNGKDVQTQLISDDKGKVIADHLAPGTYYFVETKAPNGYQLSDQKAEFEIPEEANGKPAVVAVGSYQNKVIPNDPNNQTKGNYPKMNEITSNVISWLGVLFVSVAGVNYYLSRKKKRN